MRGTVKWFDTERGFGFISCSHDATDDVFVHISELQKSGIRSVTEGQALEFETVTDPKGLRAVNLRAE
jgi:CspA family cold shock protein